MTEIDVWVDHVLRDLRELSRRAVGCYVHKDIDGLIELCKSLSGAWLCLATFLEQNKSKYIEEMHHA